VQSLRLLRKPYRCLGDCTARYGSVFTLDIIGFGKFVLVSEPDDIRKVFNEALFAGEARKMLRPIFGRNSLLVNDGDEAKWQRRFLMPHFQRDGNLIPAQQAAIAITRNCRAKWPQLQDFSLYERFEDIAMQVIIERFFGMPHGSDKADFFARLLLDFVHAAHTSPVFHFPALIDRLDAGPWRRYRTLRVRLDQAIHAELATRGPDDTDVFGMVRAALRQGEPLDPIEQRDIVVAVVGAGHETTSIALSWAFEYIAAHPQVEARLRDEIATATGRAELAAEHLDKLDYLDAVIKESMRLSPLNPVIPRLVARDETIEVSNYVVPPGVHVAANSYSAHRRAETYPDPNVFRPERFLGAARPDHYEWLPFGGGARKCIGASFAEYEMKAVLAELFSGTTPRPLRAGVQRECCVGDMAAPAGGTVVRFA
jgi:cytochrome P450